MYVKINFNSAKLNVVDKLNKTGDFDCTGNYFKGYSSRPTNEIVSRTDCGNRFGTAYNPIHMEQVSNMLHVLLGERPVSSFHTPEFNGNPIRKRIKCIDEVVKNGFFKIDNSYTYKTKEGGEKIYCEFKQGKKFTKSNPKNSIEITFNVLKNHFIANNSIERYYEFIDILSKYTKHAVTPENYVSVSESYNDLFDTTKYENYEKAFASESKISGSKISNLANELKEKKFDAKYINGTFRRPSSCNVMGSKSTNVQMLQTISLDGSFIFNLDDEMYEKLINGKKCASFLDNGVVTISTWEDDFAISSYGMYELDEEEILDMGYERIN